MTMTFGRSAHASRAASTDILLRGSWASLGPAGLKPGHGGDMETTSTVPRCRSSAATLSVLVMSSCRASACGWFLLNVRMAAESKSMPATMSMPAAAYPMDAPPPPQQMSMRVGLDAPSRGGATSSHDEVHAFDGGRGGGAIGVGTATGARRSCGAVGVVPVRSSMFMVRAGVQGAARADSPDTIICIRRRCRSCGSLLCWQSIFVSGTRRW
jgi:hypothetical protein